MKTLFKWRSSVVVLGAALVLSGCSMWPFGNDDDEVEAIVAEVRAINEKLPPMEPMVLRSTGYGAINPNSQGLSEVQKRLIAMRASKLDAYRTLAERVYGTQIVGSSTVENLVVENDRFKAFVDTHILGAKVVYQDMMADGSYETMVEMVIDEGFRNCLANQPAGRQNSRCASDVVYDVDSMTRSQLRQQGIDTTGSGLYFIE